MRLFIYLVTFVFFSSTAIAQIDPVLLRRMVKDTSGMLLNMDAVYNRPFLQSGKLPVALGGYAEANYQYFQKDGVSEGHQFQMRRLTLFVSSSISKRIKFLSEIEFEDGTKEINIEFGSVDFEFAPLFNLRGGIVMNPIGAFNQNHDGPKWEFIDRPVSATQMLPATWSNIGFGLFGKNTPRIGCMLMKHTSPMGSTIKSLTTQRAKHSCQPVKKTKTDLKKALMEAHCSPVKLR